jgi:hypothetical protein
MSVSAISSSSGLTPSAWQSQIGQIRSDFQALGKALQSGDLTAAQQAYATLQQDLPANQSSSTTGNNPLSAIGQALQSGDLTAAQQAFAALRGHHHGHYHHGGGSAVASTASAATGTTGTSLNAVA